MSTTYAKPVLNVSVTTTEYESEPRFTLSEALELFRGDSDNRVVDDVVTKKVEAWLLDDINDFGETRFEAALERIALTDPLRAIAIERYIIAWSLKHGKVIADLQLAKDHYEKQIKELGRMKSMHPLGKLCFKLFLASKNFLRDLLTRTLTEELEEKYSLAMDRQIAKQELERFVLQLAEIKQQTNQEQQKANAIMIQASNEQRQLIELANKEYLAMTTQSRREAEDAGAQVRNRLEQKLEQEEARLTRLRETNARLEAIKSDHLSDLQIMSIIGSFEKNQESELEKTKNGLQEFTVSLVDKANSTATTSGGGTAHKVVTLSFIADLHKLLESLLLAKGEHGHIAVSGIVENLLSEINKRDAGHKMLIGQNDTGSYVISWISVNCIDLMTSTLKALRVNSVSSVRERYYYKFSPFIFSTNYKGVDAAEIVVKLQSFQTEMNTLASSTAYSTEKISLHEGVPNDQILAESERLDELRAQDKEANFQPQHASGLCG